MWYQGQWVNRHNFLKDLVAALMSTLIMVLMTISLSTLICGAVLIAYLPQMIVILLASAIISIFIYAVMSSFPNAGLYSQNLPALITALIATTFYTIHPVVDEAYFATIVIVMAFISVSGGLCVLLLGCFKLGNIVRFVPYPVLAGFMAGLGGLLFWGAWPVILGQSLTWEKLFQILQFQYMVHWVPAILLGISLQYFNRRYQQFSVVIPILISLFLLSYFIVYLTLKYFSFPVEEWHLFLGPFVDAPHYWPWLRWEFIRSGDWSLLWHVRDNLLLVFVLSPIAILMSAVSFEELSRQEGDFDRELITSGIAGLSAPFLGGVAWSYIAVSTSFLNYKIGARYRINNIMIGLLGLLVLWMGVKFLGYIPRFLAPGLLFYIAFGFLIDYLYKSYSTVSKKDYAIIISIFVIIMQTNLFYGIVFGLAISLFKFAWEYSRLNPIEGIFSGEILASHVIRSPKEAQFLIDHGAKIRLIRLRGHLFFGNVYRVFKHVRALLNNPSSRNQIQYLIFDFSAVDGIDSSCRSAIRTFLAKAKEQNILVLTVGLFNGVSNAERELQDSNLDKSHDHVEVNVALEWCEQALLTQYQGIGAHERKASIMELKEELHLSAEDFSVFLSFWRERKKFAATQIVIHQNDKDRDIYFLERGILAVKIIEEGVKEINVVNIHAGSLFGEVAYYTGQTRTTNIECISECDIYCLAFEAFKQLEEKYPAIALRLHKHIALQMAENIKYANQMLQVVLH